MLYLSFKTINCTETAKKHGLLNEVDVLFDKIEKDQTVQSWDSFFPSPFIKKNLGKSYRLISSKHTFEAHDIVIISFLACFPHGGSGEYDKFLKDPYNMCGKYLPSEQTLLEYIESRRDVLPEPYPKPNENELEYLYDILEQDISSDIMVYESFSWVESMKNVNMLEMSTRLYDLLLSLLSNKEMEESEIQHDSKSGISIFYKYFPSLKSIFLIAPFFKRENKIIVSLTNKYQSIIDSNEHSEEIILKHSRRSYPSYILADEQIWKSIQKNDVGNIALSPEESLILENVTNRKGDKLYPLFINGRPGSGKSTILQYIFASYLCMYLRKDGESRLPNPPLYLTYSEKLLDSAKKYIDGILKCNSNIALHEIELNSESSIKARENCYGIFHKFLLELIPSQKKIKFSLEKKINFPLFRNLWNERRLKAPQNDIRKLSPELSWHVLRSYIKGMRYSLEDDFDDDSYSELPKSQQTVQIETFKRIYKNVWINWYKSLCEINGYWDDQDLVFFILNEPQIELSKYPAIFCDEAQDFSKLELDLILNLSLFSQRTLSPHELKHVPFIFAGDPFQTLNPTGFEWESLQANFHEKIVSGLDKASIGKLKFNYQELSYNYRSGKFIVGLCNLLQLLRGILFNQKNIKPQQNWFDTDSSMPVYFNLKDPLCEQKLRDQTEMVIILPCQEGEEEEYVKSDNFLRNLSTSDVDIRNSLSPMRAKGLEFSRVVLYKFGSVCCERYPDLLTPLITGNYHSKENDASLPLKYFINSLYVGASRAKIRLIIVDDDKGIETLWNSDILKSLDSLLKKYQPAHTFGWTVDAINYVQKGVEDNWTQDRDDPILLAESFHDAGLAENDPYKLRLAEANYMRCGQTANAILCRAERFEIEKHHSKAGELYLELDRINKALECYWSDGAFKMISSISKFANTPEHRAACFHLGERSITESQRFLDFLIEQIKGPSRLRLSWDPQWKRILDECLDSVLKNLKDDNDSKSFYFMIRGLEKEGLSPSDKMKYAQLAFTAKEYKFALKIWDTTGITLENHSDYCIARAHESPYPSNLIYLAKIKDYQLIIKEWKSNKKTKIDSKNAAIILEAILDQGDYNDAITVLIDHPEEECLRKSYDVVKNKSLESHKEIIGQLLIITLADRSKWKDIVKLFEDNTLTKRTLSLFAGVLASKIAQSREFHQTTLETKNAVALLLKKLFIDSPWDNTVSMRIVGAAIENAYKIIDALEFYEGVWKKERIAAEKKDVDYAIGRWVKSKLRLAELLEEEGKQSGADRHRSEAENVCRTRLGINKNNIPENPEYDIIETDFNISENDSPTSSVASDTRTAIRVLHNMGKSTHEIAELFSIDANIVEILVQE